MSLAEILVDRGAKMWDKKLPNWFWIVDPPQFAMGSTCNCVAGQIGQDMVNLDAIGWEGESSEATDWGWKDDSYTRVIETLDIVAAEYGMEIAELNEKSLQDRAWSWLKSHLTRADKEKLSVGTIVTYEELRAAWIKEIMDRRAASAV